MAALAKGGPGEPLCRRCLLEDMAEGFELRQTVERALSALPGSGRVPEPERRRRLEACRACEHLYGGTCRLCGCYVEIRAGLKRGRCPDMRDRWRRPGGSPSPADETERITDEGR